MKNYFLIILFYLLLSCNYNKNNILIQKTNKKIIHKIKKKKLDSLLPEQLIKLYGKSNSPDTLMPYKIYSTTTDSENLYGLINLYQTYDLNKEYFVGQIRKLFYFDKNIDNLLIKVEDNKLKIREKTRSIILDSYNEFNNLSST